jgi:hypothetical protein
MKKDQEHRPFYKRKSYIIIASILLLLIIARIALPYIVLRYVNKTLSGLHGYYGHVNGIDIHLYRGAYVIKDIYLNKVDSVTNKQVPFFSSKNIDLSVEWKALFHKRIVGELQFNDPVLRFTKDKAEPKNVQGDTDDFRHVLKKLMPLKVNRFEVNGGTIQYIDSSANPLVNLYMTNTHILAQNLSNVKDTAALPAKVAATANVYQGTVDFNMRINALAEAPTFDMDMELKNTSLPEFNDFFKAYAKFDVHQGNFGLYMEMAAKDRKYVGYVKPVIKDLKVTGPEDRKDSFLNKLWESVVGVAGKVLENKRKEQVATKVPIEGAFGEGVVDSWYAIAELLRNAFIQAIYPAIDYEVTIGDVDAVKPEEKKSLKDRIFNKDKDKDDKKTPDKEEKKKSWKEKRKERREERKKEAQAK